MQLRIRRMDCCGNAECVELVPAVFALDSKQKAIILDADAAPAEKLIEAAGACPCQAIEVLDNEGDLVFP